MAIWTNHRDANQNVYTVVHLLRDALRSALGDAWYFERTACPRPDVKGAGHAEISARLGRFRDACNQFKEREALMITKLARAREWAFSLRKLAPDVQDDVDQFLDATRHCQGLRTAFLMDAQHRFNGGVLPSRFLAQRRLQDGSAGDPIASGAARDYLVGGHTALYELRAACEVFLAQINEEFFSAARAADDGPTVPAVMPAEAAIEPAIPKPALPRALH